MPQITARLTQRKPILDVILTLSASGMRRLTESGQEVPPVQHVTALVDTGASHSCVDPTALEHLGLQPTGSTRMYTARTGTVPSIKRTYALGFILPNGKLDPLLIPNLLVSETPLLEAQGIHVILGRDVLARCILTYNGPADTITLEY